MQAEKAEKRDRAQHTMESVVERYLAAKKDVLRSESFRVAKCYLQGDYFKPLHNMPVAEIELQHVAPCLGAIIKKRSSHTANAARVALSTLFSWAMAEGLCGPRPRNPVVGTNVPRPNEPRDRVLTDAELNAIWKASGDDDFGRVVRLLILTGCRRQEIGGLRWSEVDFQKRVLMLPAERVKNKHAHILPLPDTALAIIKAMPRVIGKDTMFGAGEAGVSFWPAKPSFDARLGDAVEPWRIHDLRRTAATGMADIGVMPHVIEQLLNHRGGHRNGVAAIYNRSTYDSECRAAVEKWAKRVEEVVARPRVLKVSPERA
jgi:integrase